ncbi:disintegrin and metalloproteinase domain-containing protein 17-like [Biomphalaria glabrata]|uniref:Disintegrin and metalloproteinase domain-containing protein 17-like n=1 Tax=Biomphalaria glabrata TaxID=6526 RepID=A0A9W2Z723_BIOGL|nr:disintegrin and metalloproteinase domain-containing protein 17-like [Biomphalaria glabrata]
MWYRKSTIDHPNNKFFSPCSLRSIGETLRTKSQCFVSKHKLIPLCGNGIVERGEECDAGAIGIVSGDMCCSKFCRFIDRADCSDLNTECCANCRLASHRTVCHDYGGADCKMRTYCTGRSFHCPLPMDVDNFVPCLDGRLCYEGDCLNFCEIYSIERNLTLEPCLCQSSDKDACKWCCYDNSDPKHPGVCEPYSDQTLRDGRPCYYGFCENGMCVKADNSSDYFTETFLKKALRGGVSEFVKRNIVLVVSVMNLIFFLPMAWFICVWDMRLKMHRNSMKETGVQTVPQIQKKNTFLPRGIAALKSKFINKGPNVKQNFIIPTIVIIPPDDGSLPDDVTSYSTRMAYENNNPDWSAESKTNYEETCIFPEEARPADQPEKTSLTSAEKTISAESDESSKGTFSSIDSYMKSFVQKKVSIESWKTATQESLQSDAPKRDHFSFKPQTSRVTFKNDNSEKTHRESNTGVLNESAV